MSILIYTSSRGYHQICTDYSSIMLLPNRINLLPGLRVLITLIMKGLLCCYGGSNTLLSNRQIITFDIRQTFALFLLCRYKLIWGSFMTLPITLPSLRKKTQLFVHCKGAWGLPRAQGQPCQLFFYRAPSNHPRSMGTSSICRCCNSPCFEYILFCKPWAGRVMSRRGQENITKKCSGTKDVFFGLRNTIF